jgi:cytochrome b subunit of formate dehydrogenase
MMGRTDVRARESRHTNPAFGRQNLGAHTMATLLWILAVILVIAGIYVALVRKELLFGIILIIVGLLVGPGGVSVFT